MSDRQPVLLIVEDHPDARDLYQRIFELDGWRVIVAATGEDGLRLARSFQFDAALIDHYLAGEMHGMDLAEHLLAERLLEGKRIIICSGAEDLPRKPEDVRIVRKPVELRKLSMLLGKMAAGGPLVSLYICGPTIDSQRALATLRQVIEGRDVKVDVLDLMTPTVVPISRIDFTPLVIVRHVAFHWKFPIHKHRDLHECLDRIAPRKRRNAPRSR